MISRVSPPDEKDGTNRHEPQDRPDRKTEIHRESITERNESRNSFRRSPDENGNRFFGFHRDVISTAVFVGARRDRRPIRGMLYPGRLADRRSFSETAPSCRQGEVKTAHGPCYATGSMVVQQSNRWGSAAVAHCCASRRRLQRHMIGRSPVPGGCGVSQPDQSATVASSVAGWTTRLAMASSQASVSRLYCTRRIPLDSAIVMSKPY